MYVMQCPSQANLFFQMLFQVSNLAVAISNCSVKISQKAIMQDISFRCKECFGTMLNACFTYEQKFTTFVNTW